MNTAQAEWTVRATRGARVRCESDWHLGPAWSAGLRDFDLWFVWDGRGRMRLADQEIELAAGTLLWMRPGHRYEATHDPQQPLGVNYLHFRLEGPGNNLPLSDFKPPFEVLTTLQSDFVDQVMRRIIALLDVPESEVLVSTLLRGLLLELTREARIESTEQSGLERHYREMMGKVAARIRENPAQTPSIKQLAKDSGYSPDHFSRVFRQVTGLRPQAYVIQARLERARHLLAVSDLTVGMVALAVGFRDIFYFSRLFRHRTGFTPSAWRRHRRG